MYTLVNTILGCSRIDVQIELESVFTMSQNMQKNILFTVTIPDNFQI